MLGNRLIQRLGRGIGSMWARRSVRLLIRSGESLFRPCLEPTADLNSDIRQTETGSIVITPFPGAIPTKPGSATVPFFGIEPVILDTTSGVELEGNNVEGVLALRNPWPSIARTVYRDHKRYLETYMKVRFKPVSPIKGRY